MKFLNLLLVAAIAVTSFGIIANANPAISAYSVTNVQTSVTNMLGVVSYTAQVSTTKNPKTNGFINGTLITISTKSCTHVVDSKDGENGIIVQNGANTTLLFSSGASCMVSSVVETPAKK